MADEGRSAMGAVSAVFYFMMMSSELVDVKSSLDSASTADHG